VVHTRFAKNKTKLGFFFLIGAAGEITHASNTTTSNQQPTMSTLARQNTTADGSAGDQEVAAMRDEVVIEVADAETEHTISVIDNLNAENAATEQQRDAAVAEVASLKRKYEPDDGVVIDKLLRLSDRDGTNYMRVTVHTGYKRAATTRPGIRVGNRKPQLTDTTQWPALTSHRRSSSRTRSCSTKRSTNVLEC